MTPLELANIQQGSPEWKQARAGIFTASRAGDGLAAIKKGEAANRRDYRTELLVERLTGQPYPQYESAEMRWGKEQEPYARAAYELERDVLVDTCGLILHPTIPNFGASPDGLVGTDGMIQIKCPNTTTHLAWMLAGVIPLEHYPQMLAELACTGRAWSDFVSFDPRMPAHLQIFVRRLVRDDKIGGLISTLESEVVHFNQELDQVLACLPQGPQPIAQVLDWPKREEMEL